MMLPENPHNEEVDIFDNIRLALKKGYDEGFDALAHWLIGRCTKHQQKREPLGENEAYTGSAYYYPEHRHECPACMRELEERMK